VGRNISLSGCVSFLASQAALFEIVQSVFELLFGQVESLLSFIAQSFLLCIHSFSSKPGSEAVEDIRLFKWIARCKKGRPARSRVPAEFDARISFGEHGDCAKGGEKPKWVGAVER